MLRLLSVVLAWNLLTAVATAEIDSGNKLVIDFTLPEEAAKLATWSDPKNLGCTKEGFGWDGVKTHSYDGWLETEPLAIGLDWRPPQNARVRVNIQTNFPLIETPTPNSKLFNTPSIFVRHSADRVHWSDWQPTDIQEDPRAKGTVIFTASVGVPRRAVTPYHAKLFEWTRRPDTNWSSDEDEFCRWLVKKDPEYFVKNRPFVGYVQFLVDGSIRGGQRLTRFEANVDWDVGGAHQPPKEGAAEKRQAKSGAWSFRGVEAAAGNTEK